MCAMLLLLVMLLGTCSSFAPQISIRSTTYTELRRATTRLLAFPPRPSVKNLPLAFKLAGGLFLFQSSVPATERDLANKILLEAQEALRIDPGIILEFGHGLETGGVFSCSSSRGTTDGGEPVQQLALQFQINGGNAWAQGTVIGVQIGDTNPVLAELSVANMDAAMGGAPPITLSLPNSLDL
eukprot:CAMPEP_0195536448 /NCGR_PEP_ID=MMETSP0794_2-20130614/46087_1 /TAXON_ID=515487 /ORGANISM="Stephanopyxis turris, Strain CCMP 815" /LENGTH=182 /DNA_ID=CAMNT_0040669867 /DNA_START=103 /DNA_END=651 /DNA_ORIENTATION=+